MVEVRELQLTDFAEVRALNDRNGLRTPSETEWSRLWVQNPHADQFRDVPIGWVLIDDQKNIVGAACNVPVLYDFGGRSIRSATGMAWAVDPEHRTNSLLLLDAFFKQDAVDLLLNTSANPVAGKAWQAFRAQRLPLESYDQNLMWITRYGRFAKAATRRLGWKGASLLRLPVAGSLAGQDIWRSLTSNSSVPATDGPTPQRMDAFDDRFDTFWQQLTAGGRRKLRASRESRSLDWHFGPAMQRDQAFVIGCAGHDGASLGGYLIARRNDRPEIKLRRYQVADLQVLPGCEASVPRLVASALEVARSEKAAVVELTGFEPAKHGLAAAIPHRVRRLPTWPFFFKSRDPHLRTELQDPSAWDPSPFDGDATL